MWRMMANGLGRGASGRHLLQLIAYVDKRAKKQDKGSQRPERVTERDKMKAWTSKMRNRTQPST
jgi:hypothetical protein